LLRSGLDADSHGLLRPRGRCRVIDYTVVNGRQVSTVREQVFRDDGSLAARTIERDKRRRVL
jgi:hypothetical protein